MQKLLKTINQPSCAFSTKHVVNIKLYIVHKMPLFKQIGFLKRMIGN